MSSVEKGKEEMGDTMQHVADGNISEIEDLVSRQDIPSRVLIYIVEPQQSVKLQNDPEAVLKESRALKNFRPHNAP